MSDSADRHEGAQVVPIAASKAPLPSFTDWGALLTVCSSIEWIVDDAQDAPQAGGGLLSGFWSRVVGGDKPSKRSKLGALVTAESRLVTPYDWDLQLCKVLPGVEDLGQSRQERIQNLLLLLGKLPAYAWLRSQEPFRAALATMGGRVGALIPAYSSDIAQFRLIEAVAMPVSTFHVLTSQPGLIRFPTTAEADGALEAAKHVQRFLRVNTGLGKEHGIGWDESAAAARLVDKLAALVQEYQTRPTNELTKVKRQTLTAIIENTRRLFGKESPAVLVHLARLAGGYEIDKPNLAALIREIDGIELSPRVEPAKVDALPSTPRGVFDGLGARAGR